MKRIFLACALLVMASSLTFANKVTRSARKEARHEKKEQRKEKKAENKNEVGYATKQSFMSDFPNAREAIYNKTKNFDEVNFISSDGSKLKAYYDIASNLVGTTQIKKFSDLPEVAQRRIEKEYKDYAVGAVLLFDDNESNQTDMILYGTSFDDEDNYFVSVVKDNKETILKVNTSGNVAFFTELE
ncbi:MAG: hypothetical protein ABI687_05910 [Flavitalea sp.]